MLYAAPAFLAGVCLLLCCAPGTPLAIVLPVASLGALCCACVPRLRALAALAAGFAWAAWQVSAQLAAALPPALEGQDLLVRATVAALPESSARRRMRLQLNIDAYRQGTHWQPLAVRARLNVYHELPVPAPGERWQFMVRLKAAHGFANPAGFDYERWLFAHGLGATGYVRDSPHNRRLERARGAFVERARAYLAGHISALDVEAPQRALIGALTIGDRAGLTPEQWQTLAASGTSHLLAISGLHVGLVAALSYALLVRLWAWSGWGLRMPAPRAGALAALVAATLYALLSGFDVPARRALIMVAVWMGARVLDIRPQPLQVLALALGVVLLFDPLAVLSIGFWLSFAAVGLILLLGGGRFGERSRLHQAVSLQLGLVIGLTPLVWLGFQRTALLAPLVNLLAIPWVGLLVVPVLLLGVVVLAISAEAADALFALGGALLALLWRLLEISSAWPGAQVSAPPLSIAGYLAVGIAVLALLAPGPRSLRLLGGAALLPLLAVAPARPAPGDVWLTLLDVGQGLATVVETRNHLLVYDTGPAFPGGLDSGEAVILPFLRWRARTRIDRLVVSHADLDHRGGARALLAGARVNHLHSGEPGRLPFAGAGACRAGQRWQWDGVSFAYLAPLRAASGNNASCVLQVSAADGRTLLLTGDIERRAERALVTRYGRRLDAQVLVAPHHGSLTSSSVDFLAQVRPRIALFSTGYRNRFGFPRTQVLQRYRRLGCRVYDTAADGAVTVRIEAGRPTQVQSRRATHRRLWQYRPP